MRRAEDKIVGYILNCGVFNSGAVFPVHEIQRSIQHRDIEYGAGRVREVLNTLCEQGKAEKVKTPNGVYYRKASEARAILSRLWAAPVSAEHTPTWR
jgi:hypothetical protein